MATTIVILVVIIAILAILLVLQRSRNNTLFTDSGEVLTVEKKEESLQQASQTLRGVILGLVDAVQNVDDVAHNSNEELNLARVQVHSISMTDNLEEAQVKLVQEIDRVLETNSSLRSELEQARQTLRQQQHQIDNLQSAIRIDALTQLSNRPAFDERLGDAWNRWSRYEEHFCLLMMDVDHFKQINDNHGHPAGDRVLKGLAKKLQVSLRGSDIVARYGGEEFAAILIRADIKQAQSIAEKIRQAVEEARFHLDGSALQITISIGIAAAQDHENAPELLKAADDALYLAKRSGRNCICTPADKPENKEGS